MIVVAEQFTRPRGDVNLDRCVVTADFAVVFDGSTPKVAADGRAAAVAGVEALVDGLVDAVRSWRADLTVEEMLEVLAATARIIDPTGESSATGAIYSRALSTIVVIADSWAGWDDHVDYYGHGLERLHAAIRSAHTEYSLSAGRTVSELRRDDDGRTMIEALLSAEARMRNVDAPGRYFYAAIDGSPIPRRLVTVIEVPTSARQIILATDGYPRLGKDLAESERLLAELVARDPLMIGAEPGTKAVPPGRDAADDRTFLRALVL